MRKKSTARATTRSGKGSASKSAKQVSKKNTAAAKRSPKPKRQSKSDEVVAAEALIRQTDLRGMSPRSRFRWALRSLKHYPDDYPVKTIRAVFISVGFDPTRVDALIQSVLDANRRKAANKGEV